MNDKTAQLVIIVLVAATLAVSSYALYKVW